MNILKRLFSRKELQQGPVPAFQMLWTGSGFTMIPYAVTSYIRDGYTGNSAVYSVVTALMQKFSQVPYYVYKVKSESKLKAYKAATGFAYNDRGLLLKAAAMDEVNENHPVMQLLNKPNNYQTDLEFRQMALCFLKLTGMCGVYGNTGITGTKLQSLHVLPSQWVSLWADTSLMDAKEVYFSPLGGFTNELPRELVYLWKYINPDFNVDGSHLYGLSPLKAGLMDVKGSNEAAKQMAKMYENGGARGAFAPKEGALTPTQVSQFREAIDTWLNGNDNRGKTGGMSIPVEFHGIGLDAVDMALIQGKNISDERIALIFGYPPELLKADNKYDNAINALRKLVTNGLYSDLVAYRNLWNQWVLPLMGYKSGGYYVDFDISILPEMQSDMEKMTEQAVKLVNDGLITRNEGRTMLKYDSLKQPEMDMIWIRSGIVPITEAAMPLQDVQMTGDYDATPGI